MKMYCNLVKSFYFIYCLGRAIGDQLNAADSISKVNEGMGLSQIAINDLVQLQSHHHGQKCRFAAHP